MNTKFKDFPRGYTEDQLLFLIWRELSGGESGESGYMNSGRRKFPDGLDRADILYLIWKQLTSGERQFTSRYEASKIDEIDPKVLDSLKVGDHVAKITGNQKHNYIVTYKGDGVGEGICLSYFAAGYLETVSYDYTSSGWAYNSTDVCEIGSSSGPREHVTVRVRGCEWSTNTDVSASVTGGKVVVESWNPATATNLPRREFDIPAPAEGEYDSVVEFDVDYGVHYEVHSEVDGLGASFRPMFAADRESRDVVLWNLSVGVYHFGVSIIYTADSVYRYAPIINPSGSANLYTLRKWDEHTGETASFDDGTSCIVVSTADCSFLLAYGNVPEDDTPWCKVQGRSVPALVEYFYSADSHEERVALAMEDFSGNLNTDKIVDALADESAAYFCLATGFTGLQAYLPSVGELRAVYDNMSDINTMNSVISATTSIDEYAFYSSSCAYSPSGVLTVGMSDGSVHSCGKIDETTPLAVVAFLYKN